MRCKANFAGIEKKIMPVWELRGRYQKSGHTRNHRGSSACLQQNLIGLLRELLQRQTELAPPQIPAEQITQDGVPKQRFLIAFLLGHGFLLVLVHVMEPSMESPAALAQGLPLWVRWLAFLQKHPPNRFPAGTASPATQKAGCAPARSGSLSPPTPTREELSPPTSKPCASHRAIASDAVGLAGSSRLASGCPVWLPANPTTSATPPTAPATVADYAIPAYPCRVRTWRRSRVPSLAASNADRALPR
jgi:hypothetical protein